ncbi:LamG domain-containing protein [bacterium]|nr:LamG domain-containing protein [bacterium]
MLQADVLYEDNFDGDTLAVNSSGIGGGATNRTIDGHAWTDDGAATFVTSGSEPEKRALLYSANTFQSDVGFRLTVNYTAGTLGDSGAHNLSFGLITSDTDPSTYSGFNPFKADTSVYSIGVNLTANGGASAQGLNFTDGSTRTTLDQSGNRAQFKSGETCEVSIEIGEGGYWCYRIDGVYEASGVLLEGFDLSKSYSFVVYGQDDNGAGKTIESVKLETAPALGERAEKLRGTWTIAYKVDSHYNGTIESISIDPYLQQIKDLKTLDTVAVWLSSSSTKSATFSAPHKLLESFWYDDLIDRDVNGEPIKNLVVPRWGDGPEPENDTFGDWCRALKAEGFNVKVYVNSENIIGNNLTDFEDIDERWKAFCDTDPEAQAFINSQPFHTGVWNPSTQQYEVAYDNEGAELYPDRKYVFCYAEYIIKDYSLRYGHLISSWIFDSAKDFNKHGEDEASGLIEEQRLYQAIANAVRAGNPDIPTAFQNGRSGINYHASPFQIPTRFDDFTFGHAFGGNNDHANKVGTQFTNNYRHVTRMTATNGYVHDGDTWTWDDLIVGNFHSKHSTTSWSGGNTQAWLEEDYLDWNEEAMSANGSMTWGVSHLLNNATNNNFNMEMRGWSLALLQALDARLAEVQFPGAPNFEKANTVLTDAFVGFAYHHVLEEGLDVWDPEGDDITSVTAVNGAPAWLNISEDPLNPGHWILSGIPTPTVEPGFAFSLRATDSNGLSRDREVTIDFSNLSHPGLVADWTLDDGSGGFVADASGNGFHGTSVNSVSVAGVAGSALSFNGSDSTVTLPAAAFADLGDEITISMWVNGDTTQPLADVIFNADDSSGNRVLNIHLPWSNSKVIWDAGNSGGSNFDRISKTASPSEFKGRWNHWVFTKSTITEEMKIYLNGSLWHSGIGNTRSMSGITDATLGSSGGTSHYNGVIDEVKLYNVVLSSAEVAELYASYQGVQAWLSQFPDLVDLDPESDPDGDRLATIVEYVIGGNPTSASAEWNPLVEEGMNEVTFKFNRRAASAAGTSQIFQFSTDLIEWDDFFLTGSMSLEVLVGPVVDGIEEVMISIDEEDVEDGRAFGRLKVETE